MSSPRGEPTEVEHRFGPYGGQFVPETLMPALAELEQAWLQARAGPRPTAASWRRCCATSPGARRRCTARGRLSERVGRPLYLKREDLNHTGSHKLNNAIGQALLAQRMGKRRIIAETGAGQHGVATATACALLGLECVVYMGVEDTRRQTPNVQRMELLGASVQPVDAGARTLKEATSAAIRDWVTNVESTHYVIGSVVGPAPYPALVRDLQRVIGDEARAQILEREGRLPARVVACVGGGSNALGIFTAFLEDEQVELIGVEAGGRASRRSGCRSAAAASTWFIDELLADLAQVQPEDLPDTGGEQRLDRLLHRLRVRRHRGRCSPPRRPRSCPWSGPVAEPDRPASAGARPRTGS